MTTLADDLVSDELWALVAPPLPTPTTPVLWRPLPRRLRPACLAAIVYMARTSTPWWLLPAGELAAARPRPAGAG